jgi:hypothetical protein
MTDDERVAVYKKLAQQALDEPDPLKSLELCEKAFAMGLLLGLEDGTEAQQEAQKEALANDWK